MVLWRPTTPSRTNTKNGCPFHHRGLECKSRKSRDIWSNRQIWPWSAKWSRAKANRVLPREHTGNSKHLLPTTWDDSTYGHHRIVNTKIRLIIDFQPNMEKLYTVNKNKTRSWLWLRSWTPWTSQAGFKNVTFFTCTINFAFYHIALKLFIFTSCPLLESEIPGEVVAV